MGVPRARLRLKTMKTTRFYIDLDGHYLGAFCGCVPKVVHVEIPVPPPSGLMRWTGTEWVSTLPVDRARKRAYAADGCGADALVVALWEKIVEGRSETADALQTKRLAVKANHPKP